MSSRIATMPDVALPEGFRARRPGDVVRYLEEHPRLVPVLREARVRIREFFGPADVLLEVVTDRECGDLCEMFAYIATSLPPADAWRQLDRFDETWFLRNVPDVGGLLNFDVEFQPDVARLPVE